MTTPETKLFINLVTELKYLDAEAAPLPDGTPTGLWWYHRQLQAGGPPPGKYRNEEKMFAALADRLVGTGCKVAIEQPYASKRAAQSERCDMCFSWPGLGRTWMEVKGAWKHSDRAGRRPNPSYRKHLASAANDLSKLLRAPQDRVDSISFLLVGFDHFHDPISNVELSIIRAAAIAENWFEQSDQWHDRRPRDGCVRVWMWSRRLNPGLPEATARKALPGNAEHTV